MLRITIDAKRSLIISYIVLYQVFNHYYNEKIKKIILLYTKCIMSYINSF